MVLLESIGTITFGVAFDESVTAFGTSTFSTGSMLLIVLLADFFFSFFALFIIMID
jgi:hypothetical protein